MESIPIIDFSNPDRIDTAKNLTKAMEEIGFVYLDNVPGFNKQLEGKLLQAAKWFFGLPLEEKLKCSSKNWNSAAKGVYRGYVPINVDEGHLREQYETGEILPPDDFDKMSGNPFYEDTPWPFPDEEAGVKFRELISSTRDIFVNAGMEFLRLTAIGLGEPEDVFDDRFLPKSVSSFRIMHYPTYKSVQGNLDTLTCEEHCDGNFVTLLVTFGSPGLEIENSDGNWIKATPRPGSLIVNIGSLLSKITKRLKATKHRVRDIGVERYSLPFFFEPRYDAKFFFPDDSKTIVYGQWLTTCMKAKYGYQYGYLPDFQPPL